MSDNSEALLPCPFCGEQPSVRTGKFATSIKCENGHAVQIFSRPGAEDAAASAIAAWNTRPSSPASDGDAVFTRSDHLAAARCQLAWLRETPEATEATKHRLQIIDDALNALSALPPSSASDGGAVRETLDGNAVRRVIQDVLGADFRLPGFHANQIAAKVNALVQPSSTGGEQ